MTYNPAIHTLMTPVDNEAPRRVRRLRELGLGEQPDPEFDEFAERLAKMAGAPFAMVNFISVDHQYCSGLYIPPGGGEMGRAAPKTHGFCPHVVVRRLALVLDDVCAYPRFASNPLIDELGVRAYLGAPLIDRTDTTLGTVCVVDTQQHEWGREGLRTIKTMAAEMVDRIHRREAAQRH
jgi:GAF domain-containing protein